MREKEETLRSKLKFGFMKFCFSSVRLIVCSSSVEREYYARVFNLERERVAFIPLYVSPLFLEFHGSDDGYIFSAGRTFRDYETLLKAAGGFPMRFVIVMGRKNLDSLTVAIPENVVVKVDVSVKEYAELLARSTFVVLPLSERVISVGQQVLLESMALGKAVIVTKVPGITDYLEDMVTGLFVNAGDHDELREKMVSLMNDRELIKNLGKSAREKVITYHQVPQYITDLIQVINDRGLC
jgi:glycosyltransferase involved in cell wall biosynthesis